MPFTLFAHQSVVLPLEWVRPRWFDGAALCFGSMAPDWAYAFEGTRLSVRSHTLPAQLWWTVPTAVAATLLLRHLVAAPLSRELPGWIGAQVGALARARRSLVLTITSALVGGLSHVFIDGFTVTHPAAASGSRA